MDPLLSHRLYRIWAKISQKRGLKNDEKNIDFFEKMTKKRSKKLLGEKTLFLPHFRHFFFGQKHPKMALFGTFGDPFLSPYFHEITDFCRSSDFKRCSKRGHPKWVKKHKKMT